MLQKQTASSQCGHRVSSGHVAVDHGPSEVENEASGGRSSVALLRFSLKHLPPKVPFRTR